MEVDGDDEGDGDTNEPDPYYDSEEDDDPDDPIVRTLPVFLTPALASSLALLQYKPKVGQLELSVPLEVQEGRREQRFNEERAKLLGRGIQDSDLGAEGSGSGKAQQANGASSSRSGGGRPTLAYEEGNDAPLERMTLHGETIPDQTWYACAVVKDNEVHLTPMTRTVQMRAYLSYLDRINNLERQNARRERQAKEGGSDEDDLSAGDDDDADAAANKSAAAAIAAKKAKKAAAADKKKQSDEVKSINVSVKSGGGAGGDDGNKGGGSGDFKTGRAAASLFGPMKAAEQEKWIDLQFHDPAVSGAVGISSRAAFSSLFALVPSGRAVHRWL